MRINAWILKTFLLIKNNQTKKDRYFLPAVIMTRLIHTIDIMSDIIQVSSRNLARRLLVTVDKKVRKKFKTNTLKNE